MLRPPDLSHSTFANQLDQLVTADLSQVLQAHAESMNDPADHVRDDGAQIVRCEIERCDDQRIRDRDAGNRRQETECHGAHRCGEQRCEQHLVRRVRDDEREEHNPHAFRREIRHECVHRRQRTGGELGRGDNECTGYLKEQPQIEDSARRQTLTA